MKGCSTLPTFDKLEIFPIGSIYTSINSTNPATLFGGTWTQIQGRFLLSASSAYAAGGTGGASTVNLNHVHSTANHTLTSNEMPSHTHNVGYHETSGNYVPKGTKSLWSFRTESEIYTPAINGVLTDMAPHGYTTTHFNQNTGGGAAHNHGNTGSNLSSSQSIMPPYLVVYMWQRTG